MEYKGKIYFSEGQQDFNKRSSNPLFYGYHIIDYCGTDKWPVLIIRKDKCRFYRENSKQASYLNILMEMLEADHPSMDHSHIDVKEFPPLFDLNNIFLIDLLLLIGVKLNLVNLNEIADLSVSWNWEDYSAQIHFKNIDIAKKTLRQLVNHVVDVLVLNKIKIACVSDVQILEFPPEHFDGLDFPKIGELSFVCYNPNS